MGTTLLANACQSQTHENTASHDYTEDYSAEWEAELLHLEQRKGKIADLQRSLSQADRAILELQQGRDTLAQELAQSKKEQEANVNRMTRKIRETAGMEDLHDT